MPAREHARSKGPLWDTFKAIFALRAKSTVRKKPLPRVFRGFFRGACFACVFLPLPNPHFFSLFLFLLFSPLILTNFGVDGSGPRRPGASAPNLLEIRAKLLALAKHLGQRALEKAAKADISWPDQVRFGAKALLAQIA